LLSAELERVVRERDAYKQRAEWFEAQLERIRYEQKTPREKVDHRQIQLVFEPFLADLLGPDVAPDEEGESEPDEKDPEKKKKRKVTKHGRRNLAASEMEHLPTQTIVLEPVPLPEGAVRAMSEVSWRLGFQKARWIRLKIIRPMFAIPPTQASVSEYTKASFFDTDGSLLATATDLPSASASPGTAEAVPAEAKKSEEKPTEEASRPIGTASAGLQEAFGKTDKPIQTFEDLARRTLLIAPMPTELIPRGLPSVDLLAHLLFSKFALHLPFHRLERHFTLQGMSLTRGTMCGWTSAAHEMAKLVVEAMENDARDNAHVILTDATGVLVQDNEKCRKGHFWVYVADRQHVIFRFSSIHSKEEPKAFFKAFKGVVVSDAAAVFNALFGEESGPGEANCWSHARRYFFKAIESEHKEEALVGVGFCNQLFEWERQWKKEPPSTRQALRQKHSAPLLERMQTWMEAQRARSEVEIPVGSRLRKALNYLENQWSGLCKFVEDGHVPIHNNDSERQLRRLAVGRKNWMFVYDEETAPWTGTFVTLLASCELHGLEGEQYLRELFRVLPWWPKKRLLELSPAKWRETRKKLVEAELAMPLGPLTVPK